MDIVYLDPTHISAQGRAATAENQDLVSCFAYNFSCCANSVTFTDPDLANAFAARTQGVVQPVGLKHKTSRVIIHKRGRTIAKY